MFNHVIINVVIMKYVRNQYVFPAKLLLGSTLKILRVNPKSFRVSPKDHIAGENAAF